MTIEITDGSTVMVPNNFGIYRSSRGGGTRVHDIPGAQFPDYTLRRAGARVGSMRLFFDSEEASKDAEDAHALASVFVLSISENPTAGMSYVVPEDGEIVRYQHDRNPDWWVLDVSFHEVAP